MSHVEDRWFRRVNGRLVKTARHGSGMRYRARWTDPAGAERAKSFPDGQKTVAENFLTQLGADMLRGTYADPKAGKITLREYAQTWLDAQTFDDATRANVTYRLNSLVFPMLGSRRLDQLAATPSLIQAWLRGLKCAPSTARQTLGNLSSIFLAAIDDGRVARNPCRARSVKPPELDRRKVVPLTAGQLAALHAAMPARLAAMVDAGHRAGLRQSEVFALSPDDIDRRERLVHVVRQVKLLSGGLHFALPKRGKTRDVPLSAAAGRVFAAHLLAHGATPVTLKWHEPGTRRHGKPVTVPLYFTTQRGGAWHRNVFNRRVWKPALAAAGLPGTRENGMHVLRHSFVSSLIAAGIDVRKVAAAVGHEDPAFTLRVYGHLYGDAEDVIRRALDAADKADDVPGTDSGEAGAS